MAEFCTNSKASIEAGASASYAALDAALTQLSSLEQMIEEHQDQAQSLTEATQEIIELGEDHQGDANTRATELASTLTQIMGQIEALKSTLEAKRLRLAFIDDFMALADDYVQQVEMIEAELANAEKLASSNLPTPEAKTGNERHLTPLGSFDCARCLLTARSAPSLISFAADIPRSLFPAPNTPQQNFETRRTVFQTTQGSRRGCIPSAHESDGRCNKDRRDGGRCRWTSQVHCQHDIA